VTDAPAPLLAPPAAVEAGLGFDDVFLNHYPVLVRSLTAACGDRELAADCVQDAFVKAHVRWRKISRYDNPVAWVRRVAINKMRDDFRKQARGEKARRLLATGALTDVEVDDGPVVEGSTIDDLDALLAVLPPQQRLALSLYYVEGLTVAETAEAMSLSEGAVKYHMSKGRARLRPELEEARDA
jgi:RNA polymerase sigma-70 factor (ECF subfamily)